MPIVNVNKSIIEFQTGNRVVQVNKALFQERLDQFIGNYGETKQMSIYHIFSADGKYIGSHSGFLYGENSEYYLPKGNNTYE